MMQPWPPLPRGVVLLHVWKRCQQIKPHHSGKAYRRKRL
jgi:hypothetical protein